MSTQQTLIWATDGSTGADAAFAHARCLFPEARFVAVHCDQVMAGRGGGYSVLADEDDLRGALEARIADLREQGVEIELVVSRGHQGPAEAIATVASEREAAAAVCGTRGHGALTGALLGSVAQRLLHVSPCPVIAGPDRLTEPEAARAAKSGATA